MRVKAQGDGYGNVYRARNTPAGWCFIEPGGTFLTPGIGRPMFYPTPERLLEAVQDRVVDRWNRSNGDVRIKILA